jgi:hypothetical protein
MWICGADTAIRQMATTTLNPECGVTRYTISDEAADE